MSSITLDVIGAINKEEQVWKDLDLIIRCVRNKSLVARELGTDRMTIWRWLHRKRNRIPTPYIFLINEWAEKLRKQLPQSSLS